MERNPFQGLDRQVERLQEQFDEMLRMWDDDRLDVGGRAGVPSRMGIDLVDRGEEFVVTADVPGFEADDIDLHLSDDTLHVTAEREEEEREGEEGVYLRSERERRTVQRTVRIPEPVEESASEATYQNGVLTVTLPKMDPSDVGGTRIDIG